MDRKTFLGAAGALIGGVTIPFKQSFANESSEVIGIKKPPYLRKGDTIGITAPAGFITQEEIQPAVQVMQSWGYNTVVGDTIGKKNFTFGGTDDERLNDLQKMLDDPKIRAIMCARGGYGSIRIVDKLDWTRFKLKPKWVIGFSDITVLHSHIQRNLKIASIHSKMINSFPDDWNTAEPIQIETIISIQDALGGKKMSYSATPNTNNKQGLAEGVLVGGNLKTLETLSGTASDINTDGKILFVEDTGEYLYSIDRMFWNLKRTGKLKGLKALIVGGFRVKPDDPGEEFGKTIEDIVLEKVSGYNYPVCFDFPVGHQMNNFALKCGVKHRLLVKENEVSLSEIL
ncbi:MAG: S66 peptidase family protein [Flavisolibacter sp.]